MRPYKYVVYSLLLYTLHNGNIYMPYAEYTS